MASAASVFLAFLLAFLCLLLLSSETIKAETVLEDNVLEMVTGEVVRAPVPPVQFTHYVLALQWPPSICTQVGRHCRDITVPRRFTIHGLWPSNSRGDPVENCDPTSTFDFSQIMSLDAYPKRELSTKWPTLSNSITQQEFFRKEWMKHGTCSGLSQFDYFQTALKLYDTVNLYNRLSDRDVGVTPGKTVKYNPATVVTKYNTKWKLLIKIKCVNKSSTTEMIGEIHSRINKNGVTVESVTGSTNMCRTTSVGFPDRA